MERIFERIKHVKKYDLVEKEKMKKVIARVKAQLRIYDKTELGISNIENAYESTENNESKESYEKIKQERESLSKNSAIESKKDKSDSEKIPQRLGDVKVIDTHLLKRDPLKENQPFGYIYLGINKNNGKLYVGQTLTERHKENQVPIVYRWNEHIKEAKALRKLRRMNPDQAIPGTHLNNALITHGSEVFVIKQIDTAKSQTELDKKETYYIKKYDSMNHEKGYNMTEGKQGGKLRPEVKKKISEGTKKRFEDPNERKKTSEGTKKRYEDPEERRKVSEGTKKRYEDPNERKTTSEGAKKRYEDPNERKKISKGGKKRYEDPRERKKSSRAQKKRYEDPKEREKISKAVKIRWADPEERKKLRESHKKPIKNIKKFLSDLKKGMLRKDMAQKYNLAGRIINRKIKEMIGYLGVNNYREFCKYLKYKNINEVLKELNL